jgi:hypothetical protein
VPIGLIGPNYGNDILDSLNFALPRKGCGSEPRVAASATLGPKDGGLATARRLRQRNKTPARSQMLCGWRRRITILPRVAEAATLGFETQTLWGKGKGGSSQTGVCDSSMSLLKLDQTLFLSHLTLGAFGASWRINEHKAEHPRIQR